MTKKETIKNYDLIIGGGGPAGLSVASEIKGKGKFLLLEKNKLGTTTKSWASWAENIEKNNLDKFVITKTSGGVFKGINGEGVVAKGVLTHIIDEKKLLDFWLNKIKKNEWNIKSEAIKKIKKETGGVVVETDKGKYFTKLFIDCMGNESPLVSLSEPSDVFWWSCFGYRMAVKHQLKNTVVIENVLSDPMTYYMYYPVGKGAGDPIIFIYSRKKIDFAGMKTLFKKIKRTRPELKGAKIIEEKSGYIPLWSVKHKALDNILFLGDMGGWTLNLTGTGFNSILKKYKRTAKFISSALRCGDFSAGTLGRAQISSRYEEDNDELQKIFTRIMAHVTPAVFEKLVLGFQNNESILAKFVQEKLNKKDIKFIVDILRKSFAVKELFMMSGAKDASIVIIKSAKYLGKRFLHESHDDYHKFSDKPCALCVECGCKER